MVATHWNLHGQPTGWMSKTPGLLSAPLLNVGLCLLLTFLPQIDPRLRRDPAASTARYRRTLRWCRYALTTFLAAVSVAIIAIAAGWPIEMPRLIFNGMLLLVIVIGNLSGNLPPNYLMGIRTPWTLEDAATWRATHRVSGRLMVFGGLALLVVGQIVPAPKQILLLIGFFLVLIIHGLGYSAWFYQRAQRMEAKG